MRRLRRHDWFAVVLLAVFFMLMGWSVYQGMTGKGDPIVGDVDAAAEEPMPLGRAIFWLVFGLVLLVASSRLLVWGAVSMSIWLSNLRM